MGINHIGFIMDGNRRYAKKNNLPIKEGYKIGMEKFIEIISFQIKHNIFETSFFALSQDNGKKRTVTELKAIFDLLEFFSKNSKTEEFFKENNIKINLIGDVEGLKKETIDKKIFAKGKNTFIDNLQKKFDSWNEEISQVDFVVNVALNYDGQNEIVYSFQKIFSKIQNNELKIEDVNEDIIKQNLWFKSEPAEIIVRTGDAPRLSGFMLWDSKYSELYLTKKLWPELDENDFVSIIEWYNQIKRNFGK